MKVHDVGARLKVGALVPITGYSYGGLLRMIIRRDSILSILCSAFSLFFTLGIGPTACLAVEASTGEVRRADPRSGEPVPVDPAQIKPGKIYSHFSPRHNRYVWAYAVEGGGFSYALGPGSTELPENFDLATSSRETQQLVEEAAGTWFEKSRTEASKIYVRLGTDGRWEVVPTRTIRSHYDLDSGLRWEWHGRRRVSVLNSRGYHWGFNGKSYVPASSPVVLGPHISSSCACVH